MTKYVLLISFLVFCRMGYSQEQMKNSNSNIVFIYFNEFVKEQKKITKATYENNEDKKPYIYFYYFYNSNNVLEKTPLTFNFINSSDIKKNQPLRIRVHKSFLRKNKEIILTQKIMYKIGKEHVLQKLENAKTIFLIDESQKKNNTLLLKEVFYIDRRPI